MEKLFQKISGIILYAIFLGCIPSQAQIDLSRYLDEGALPLLNLNDHLTVKFQWNMKGNVQAALNEGLNNLDEGRVRLAIANFDEVIKLDPALWVSYYYRGISHKKLHQFPEAERDFEMSTKLSPKQPEIYVELGEVYHLKRDFVKAGALYAKSISVDPKFVEGYFSLGNLAFMEGDHKNSLRYYENCNSLNPGFPGAYMMEGILKFKGWKNDPASISFFNKALEADSTYSQTYFWRGLTYVGLGQPEKGVSDWNKLVRFNPSNSFYVLMRGFLLIELNQFEEAFIDLRKGLRAREVEDFKFNGQQTLLDKQIDLQSAANYLIRYGYGLREEAFRQLKKGFCLLLAGRYLDAYNSLIKSEKVQESACVQYLKAIAFEHSGQHQGAYIYYNNALVLDPDIFDAYKKRSIYRFELKDWSGAYADIKEMFRLEPGSPAAYRLRGLIKSNEKDFPGAIQDLSQFLKTDSTDFEALRTRGACKQLSGDLRGANEDYLRILAINPQEVAMYNRIAQNWLTLKDTAGLIDIYRNYADHTDVLTPHFELIKLFIGSKKFTQAQDEIIKAKSLIGPNQDLNPTLVSQIMYFEGMIEFQKSAYDKAIAIFNKALNKDRTNLEALYHRAKGYELLGQNKKALMDYGRLKAFHYLDAEQRYDSLAGK